MKRTPKLPLELVLNPIAAFSLRKIKKDYSGYCLRVRRTSDNTESDIGFNSDGSLDISSLQLFCGSGDGYVSLLYNQVEQGNLTQSVSGLQPKIVSSGTIYKYNNQPRINFTAQYLSGNLTRSVTSNNLSVMMVVQSRASTHKFNTSELFTIKSGTSECYRIQTEKQSIRVLTRITPGGSSSQTTDPTDYHMLWSRLCLVGCTMSGTTASIIRNDEVIDTFGGLTNIGSSGTRLDLGNTSLSNDISEFILYDRRLLPLDITELSNSINYYHKVGAYKKRPQIALEERMPWDRVLRQWMSNIKQSDLDIDYVPMSWDGTYIDNDHLLKCSDLLNNIVGTSDHSLDGLLLDSRWWRLLPDSGDYGLESYTLPNSSLIESSGNLRFNYAVNHGTSATFWTNLYILSLKNANGTEANPYYLHRGLGLRALMAIITMLIQYHKEVDHSQSHWASIDFSGGTFAAGALVYKRCGHLLPKLVQNAFIEMLKYCAHRLSIAGPHGINSNMDCKGIEALAIIYSMLGETESAAKQEILSGAKWVLFGSTSGTPETSAIPGIYSPGGHIIEGDSPETTYNGHSIYHLVGGMSHVRGDSNWNFLQTVIDNIFRFKFLQHFIQPGGDFHGPAGYGGRTGGSRVNDQGLEEDTYHCGASFSVYGRPIETTLLTPSSLISNIQSKITDLNTEMNVSPVILSGSGAHTKGINVARTSCVVHTNPSNYFLSTTHNLISGVAVKFNGTLPSPISNSISYFVINQTTDTFQIATSPTGTPITLTTSGSSVVYRPGVYLSGNPDLNYTTWGSSVGYVNINNNVRFIVFADNTNKILYIDGSLNIPEGSPQNWTIENGFKKFARSEMHWPAQWISFPDTGYYDAQNLRISGNDNTLKTPWQLSGNFSYSINDEFWLYKNSYSGVDFGWMVETLERPGSYDGWWGGSVHGFWTRDIGSVVDTRHDKSGSGYPDENTRYYPVIDDWMMNHFWIVDDGDLRFSSSTPGTGPTRTAVYDISGSTQIVSFQSILNMHSNFGERGSTGNFTVITNPTNQINASGLQNNYAIKLSSNSVLPSGLSTGIKYFVINASGNTLQLASTPSGTPITISTSGTGTHSFQRWNSMAGTWTTNHIFEALPYGLGHTFNYSISGSDRAKEFWYIIPVFLRDGGHASTTETTITYWTGTTWASLTTTPKDVDWVRLSKTISGTTRYLWINFNNTQSARLNGGVWVESYMGDGRYRSIKLDMHGNPGTSITIPSSGELIYSFTLDNPGFVSIAPSVITQFPESTDTLFVSGRWVFRADVEWVDTTGTVSAEYTLDGSGWVTAGSMNNVSGRLWDYVGGTVPSGVQQVRIKATPPSGVDGVDTLNVVSLPQTLVLEDYFTASNDTLVNGTYSAWATNNTGAVYVPRSSDINFINNNTCGISGTVSTNSQYPISIDCGSADSIISGKVRYGFSHDAMGCGIASRMGSSTIFCIASAHPARSFNLRWINQGGSTNPSAAPPIFLPTTGIGSVSRNDEHDIVLQTVGKSAVADLYTSGVHRGTVYYIGLTETLTDERVGFVAPTLSATGFINEFKVYIK